MSSVNGARRGGSFQLSGNPMALRMVPRFRQRISLIRLCAGWEGIVRQRARVRIVPVTENEDNVVRG